MQCYLGPYKLVDSGAGFLVYEPPPGALLGHIDLRSLPQMSSTDTIAGVGFFMFDTPISDSAYTNFGNNLDATVSLINRNRWGNLVGVQRPSPGTLREVLAQTLTNLSDPSGLSVVRSLMPNLRCDLEIHCGGKIFERGVRPGDGHFLNVIQQLRDNYQRIRQWALANYPEGDPRRDIYRRLLGAWRRKYRPAMRDDEDYRLFLGNEPDEGMLEPTTSYTEDFNGVDKAGVGYDLTWTEVSNTWSNTSNQLYYGSVGGNHFQGGVRAEHDLSTDDQVAEISVTFLDPPTGSFTELGAAVRFDPSATSTSKEWYAAGKVMHASVPKARTYKWVANAVTNIGVNTEAGESSSLPEVWGIRADGSSIVRIKAGTDQDETTDTSLTGHLRAGVAAVISSSGGVANDSRGDDWSVTDFVAGGAFDVDRIEREFNRGSARGFFRGFS